MADVDPTTVNGGPDVFTSRKASTEDPMRPNERELVEWVDGLFTDAEKAKNEQARPDEWEDWTSVYWGDQWPSNLPAFKSPIVVNEIKALALQELSDLTDSRITVYVQKDPTKGERDKNVEKSVQGWWERNFADLAVMEAALDGLIYPCGFLQVSWNPSLQNGQGEICLTSRDPLSYFPDPDATSDEDLQYEITRDVLDLTTIQDMYPDTGGRVEPEGDYSVKLDSKDRRPHPGLPGFRTPLYSGSTSGTRVEGWKTARAAVKTVLVNDPALSEEVEEIQGQLRATTKRKYPHRRLIVVANQRVLFEGPNPYEGRFIHRVILQPPVHTYWPAASFVSEYEWIQKTANKMDSMVAENAVRLNGGVWIFGADSGIDAKTFQNIPGQALNIKPGSTVEGKYPPPMPPDMVQAGDRFREFIRQNAGFSVRRRGGGVPGNVSADMADTEISQSMGLTRLRARLLHQSVQRAVETVFRFMALFYTTPRHVPFIVDNKWETAPWIPMKDRTGYAVHVDPDSYQVKSKAALHRTALMLAKFRAMPTGDLLKILEIPDAEGIANRMKEELMLMALARGKGGKGKK